MVENRESRKEMDRATWFHDKLGDKEAMPTLYKKSKGKPRQHLTPAQLKYQPAYVPFVLRTSGCLLLTQLRKAEGNLQSLCTTRYKRVKLVEEGGSKLKYMLVKSAPWKDRECHLPHCTVCSSEEPKYGTCKVRTIVYDNSCTLCAKEGKKVRYIGESARTIPERYTEHQADSLNRERASHMRQHTLDQHP